MDEIIHPTVHALERAGAPYKGACCSFGLMITKMAPN